MPDVDAPDPATGGHTAPMRALLATVASFWPEAEVRLGRVRPARDRALEGTRWQVVPDLRRPRMLLPRGRREAAGALLRFSAALSARETVSRLGTAAAAAGLGPGALAPDSVSVVGGGDSLARHLAEELGHEVSFSITIGTVRANRKPVLQLFDPRGRCVGFAKVGDTAVARGHIAGESAALHAVEGRLGPGIGVPRVLSLTQWRGMLVLLISQLPTRPQDPRQAGRIPLPEMRSFADRLATGSAALRDVPQWSRLTGTADRLASPALRAALADGLDRLGSAAGDREFGVGAWHGDWTAWNMARRGGILQLWDFERFETGVVTGLDPFHYAVNTAVRSRGFTVDAVLGGVRDALHQVGDTAEARVLARVHLAALGVRYAAFAEQDGGSVVAPRAALMAEALRVWLP